MINERETCEEALCKPSNRMIVVCMCVFLPCPFYDNVLLYNNDEEYVKVNYQQKNVTMKGIYDRPFQRIVELWMECMIIKILNQTT